MATHLDLEEQEQIDQLKHFWSTWGTVITAVVVVAAGSLAAWNGYQYWQNRQSSQAAGLYDAIEVAVKSSDAGRIEQAFTDLRTQYPGTTQAGQAGLMAAKSLADAGKAEAAQAALTWVADNAKDDGLKAVAKLRLADALIESKSYDQALAQLNSSVPAAFAGTFADRKGDVLMLQGKNTEAATEYTRAYKALDSNLEYRYLVQVKLNALGVQPEGAPAAATSGA